jgi:hypothetical protein
MKKMQRQVKAETEEMEKMSRQLAAVASYYKPVCLICIECWRLLRYDSLDDRGFLALAVMSFPRGSFGVDADSHTMQWRMAHGQHTHGTPPPSPPRPLPHFNWAYLQSLCKKLQDGRIISSSPGVSFCSGCFLLCMRSQRTQRVFIAWRVIFKACT